MRGKSLMVGRADAVLCRSSGVRSWGEGYMRGRRGYWEYIQLCRYHGITNGWPLDVKENENWY